MGFTPDFDTVGGTILEIVNNISSPPAADLETICHYLNSIKNLFKQLTGKPLIYLYK